MSPKWKLLLPAKRMIINKEKLMRKKILVLNVLLAFLLFPLAGIERMERGEIPPESHIGTFLRQTLPAWDAVSSKACTDPLYDGPPAWVITLSRPVNAEVYKRTQVQNAFMRLVLVQDREGLTPSRLLSSLSWKMPYSELNLRTLYLGRSRGYLWFAKGDLFHLELLQRALQAKGGRDMAQEMAKALNEEDFELFSAKTALGYFRGKGDKAVPYIMASAKEWMLKEKKIPYQHLEALKQASGKEADKALMFFAGSRDHNVGRAAITVLLREPCTLPEKELLRILHVPAFTVESLQVLGRRGKLASAMPGLKRLLKRPRTIVQYAIALETIRKIEKNQEVIQEFAAVNHIKYRMVRLGDTKNSSKYIGVDEQLSQDVTNKAERKRIEEPMQLLLTSKDPDSAVAASLLLASLSQGDEDYLAKSYITRVRNVGVELLQKLPVENVQKTVLHLAKTVTDRESRYFISTIATELGINLRR